MNFTQTWTLSYSGAKIDIENYSLLDNFNYIWNTFINSDLKTIEINQTASWTYETQIYNYSPKLNSIDNNLFEIKIILLIIMFLLFFWLTYSLILSTVWKRL